MGKWDKATFETRVSETGDTIVFDTIGDTWTGIYIGSVRAGKEGADERDMFTILQFTGEDDKPYQVNAGWKLERGMSEVEPGSLVRITYVKDVDTGAPQPMKDFRIEVAR